MREKITQARQFRSAEQNIRRKIFAVTKINELFGSENNNLMAIFF